MDFKMMFFYIFAISSFMLSFCIESVITKIAYKKTINLKETSVNKNKTDVSGTKDEITQNAVTRMSKENDNLKATALYHKVTSPISNTTDSTETTTSMANIKTTIISPRDIPCTCGIFLGSQFIKGSSDPPIGEPVISTTLERSFACNIIGQKQCQTKCLEQIIQHIPNSAKILCASLDRDIHKEKAFLFIRNCNKKWHNTNLTTGREYCCKNGLPYNCRKK